MPPRRELLLNYWQERIRRDLASFCDPGLMVDVVRQNQIVTANWVMHGKAREDKFNIELHQNGVSVYYVNGGTSKLYRTFIAGPEMADLRQISLMIKQSFRSSEIFVDTQARTVNDAAISKDVNAIQLLGELIKNPNLDATNVIMVTGSPGSGKTKILREIVRQMSADYLDGRAEKILLYLNTQGRALARFTEALVTELQDLRVGLTYHSIVTLTRLGLLVPVIDGFDELLGMSGYDDAFSSLDVFLGQLEGEGQLIASSRSIYYEDEFRSRAASDPMNSSAWEHVPVRISNWTDSQKTAYLVKYFANNQSIGNRSDEIRSQIRNISDNHSRMLSKPLFFAKTVELLHRNRKFNLEGYEFLLDGLVCGFLEREKDERLLDQRSNPLLSVDQISALMCELAQEMWNQETRVLDSNSVREVAEHFLVTENLPESAKLSVLERAPTLVFLDASEHTGNWPGISFEHEAFFFYFLARSIVSQIQRGRDLRTILGRSPLAQDVATRVASELRSSNQIMEQAVPGSTHNALQPLLDALGKAGQMEGLRTAQVRENAGLIAMEILRQNADNCQTITNLIIRSVVFAGDSLKGVVLRNCRLIDVLFKRTDLTETRFLHCHAERVYMVQPSLRRGSTQLELLGIDPTRHIAGILSDTGNDMETIYAPATVATELVACGFPSDQVARIQQREVSPQYIEIMERLMRAYRRSNPICLERDHPATRHLLGDDNWNTIEELLLKHGIAAREQRQIGGTKRDFLRRKFLPDQIMVGLDGASVHDPRIREFWDELASISVGNQSVIT